MFSTTRMLCWIGVISIFGFLLTGCSEEQDASLSVTGVSGSKTKLNGDWETECQVSGSESAVSFWSVNNKKVTQAENQFFNAACTEPVEYLLQGRYKITLGVEVTATWSGTGAPNDLSDRVTATQSTATEDASAVTFFGTAALTWANETVVAYGFSDWEEGTAKEVTGIALDGTSWNGIVQDLILIDDTGEIRYWYRGNASSAGADGFPTTLSPTRPGIQ